MPINAFPTPFDPSLTSTRAKTYRLLLASAMALYDEGAFPSITELAAHAQVSRATAYRYFPTQSALISAVVAESLGPILEWRPQDDDALKRIQQLLTFAYPQMERHEGALRAALQLSLQQWAHATPGEKFVRGNRKRLLALAVEPLQGKLPPDSLRFDEAKAKAQIDAIGKAQSERMLERAKAENKMYNLLTPEQKKQYNENYQKREQKMMDHMNKMKEQMSSGQ